MKKKRLIGLLLTVALLIVAMLCQVVSAWSEEKNTIPELLAGSNFDDYYVKSQKVYLDGELIANATYDNTYNDDGSIDVAITVNRSNGSTSEYSMTVLKEYDYKDRLISFKSVSDTSVFNQNYIFKYGGEGQYIICEIRSNGEPAPSYTYDPEIQSYYLNGWTFEYDENGMKTKKSLSKTTYGTHETYYTYQTDPATGKVNKKNYTVYEHGNLTESGSVDITYSDGFAIHKETKEGVGSVITTYDSDNRIVNKTAIEEDSLTTEYDYTYDDAGNVVRVNEVHSYGESKTSTLTEFTYEYHPHKAPIPVIPEDIVAEETYEGNQESLNDGDDISIAMTEPDPSTIKSAGVQTYEDGTQYYLNEITEPLDASEDQVFALNITGSAVNNVDTDNPAPANSFAIYDDNTFTQEHLVATVENGKLVDAKGEQITQDAPVRAMIRGALVVAAPKVATSGYNVSVTVPANTLEEGKTYYFVLSRDMVTNEEDPNTTNTDIVFKFNTAKPHVHTEKTVPAKEATCTEPGLKEGKVCEECGEVLVAQEEIPALGHDYKDGVCTRCGAIDPDYKPDVNNDLDPSVNGIVQCPDGRWAMYKNGKVDTTCTTIAQNKYGWWRVENGYVNFDAQGIYQNKFGWWKTTNGKVTFKETGIFENENGTWRVENSKVNFAANGIYQGKDGWYKTTNGKVTFKENGIFQNQFGWWYVKNSKVDFDYTGIASNNYGKWYINKGKVDFTKVGFVKVDGKTYTVMFGKVIFG